MSVSVSVKYNINSYMLKEKFKLLNNDWFYDKFNSINIHFLLHESSNVEMCCNMRGIHRKGDRSFNFDNVWSCATSCKRRKTRRRAPDDIKWCFCFPKYVVNNYLTYLIFIILGAIKLKFVVIQIVFLYVAVF